MMIMMMMNWWWWWWRRRLWSNVKTMRLRGPEIQSEHGRKMNLENQRCKLH